MARFCFAAVLFALLLTPSARPDEPPPPCPVTDRYCDCGCAKGNPCTCGQEKPPEPKPAPTPATTPVPPPAKPEGTPAVGCWRPADDGSGDSGWWEGDTLKGRYVKKTGLYMPWDGVKYSPARRLRPVVTVYTATWCKPCQSMKAVLSSEAVRSTCDVEYVDVGDGPFPEGVKSLPTCVVGGRDPLVGARPLSAFLSWIRGR